MTSAAREPRPGADNEFTCGFAQPSCPRAREYGHDPPCRALTPDAAATHSRVPPRSGAACSGLGPHQAVVNDVRLWYRGRRPRLGRPSSSSGGPRGQPEFRPLAGRRRSEPDLRLISLDQRRQKKQKRRSERPGRGAYSLDLFGGGIWSAPPPWWKGPRLLWSDTVSERFSRSNMRRDIRPRSAIWSRGKALPICPAVLDAPVRWLGGQDGGRLCARRGRAATDAARSSCNPFLSPIRANASVGDAVYRTCFSAKKKQKNPPACRRPTRNAHLPDGLSNGRADAGRSSPTSPFSLMVLVPSERADDERADHRRHRGSQAVIEPSATFGRLLAARAADLHIRRPDISFACSAARIRREVRRLSGHALEKNLTATVRVEQLIERSFRPH